MQQFESFRAKLTEGVPASVDGDVIVFQGYEETFPVAQQLPILKPHAPLYTYASIWLAIELVNTTFTFSQYMLKSRELKAPTFKPEETALVKQYITGEVSETPYFVNIVDFLQGNEVSTATVDRNTKTIKKQKVSALTMNEYVQLEQTIAPNVTFTMSNTPFQVHDYISTMSEIYAELLADYQAPPNSSSNDKRKQPSSSSSLGGIDKNSQPTTANTNPDIPIIIVPGGVSTSFTFKNMGDLLQDAVYHRPNSDESVFKVKPKKTHNENLTYDQQLYYDKAMVITRPSVLKPGTAAKFQISCDPSLLSTRDWDRVVAIFVSGKAYQLDSFPSQFKFPNGQVNLPQLFATYTGLYCYFDNELIPQDIPKWNVSQHKFSFTKRHQDQIVMTEIWKKIVENCHRRTRINPNLYF